jgi:hypothetical protein
MNRCSLLTGIGTSKTYIVFSSGTYVENSPVVLIGTRVLVGDSSLPTITSSTVGDIIQIGQNSAPANITFDSLTVSGATGSNAGTNNDNAIECMNTGVLSVIILNSTVTNNYGAGIEATGCDLTVRYSEISGNTQSSIRSVGGSLVIDASLFIENKSSPLEAYGSFAITNSFFVRNAAGLNIDPETPSTQDVFQFNTIADNASGNAFAISTGSFAFANNIFARSGTENIDASDCTGCTFPGSISVDDVTSLHFVSPDIPPYDYHLGSGSVAIDTAVPTSVPDDHDYDGQPRPAGSASDVGADEFE